jgi:hypothetical protein
MVPPIVEESDSPFKQPLDLPLGNNPPGGLTTFQNYIIAKNSSPLSKLLDRSNASASPDRDAKERSTSAGKKPIPRHHHHYHHGQEIAQFNEQESSTILQAQNPTDLPGAQPVA